MNLYHCWYQGIPGQCCKQQQHGWLFVPESGQVNNRMHRNLKLSDLVFRNRSEYRHELEQSRTSTASGLGKYLRRSHYLSSQAVTVGGRLFMPGQ